MVAQVYLAVLEVVSDVLPGYRLARIVALACHDGWYGVPPKGADGPQPVVACHHVAREISLPAVIENDERINQAVIANVRE